jgi:hypothetical protein
MGIPDYRPVVTRAEILQALEPKTPNSGPESEERRESQRLLGYASSFKINCNGCYHAKGGYVGSCPPMNNRS